MGSGCLDSDDSDVWGFSICLQFYMEGWTHDTKRLQLDVPRIQKGFGQSWGLLHTTRNFPRDGNDTRVWKRFLQHDTVQMKASKAQSHLYAGNSSKLDPSCSQVSTCTSCTILHFPDSGPWLPGLPELLVIESQQLLAKPPQICAKMSGNGLPHEIHSFLHR